MTSFSVVVLTKDSKRTLGKCLKSVSWADEVIIVDDYSTQKYKTKAKVFKRHLKGDWASQRNFALSKVKNDWVLFLDSDEVFVGSKPKVSNEFNGYYLKRRDVFWGKELKHGEVGNSRLLRLAKKGKGRWRRRVHEYWDVRGKIGTAENSILHHSHPNVEDFISKINFYAIIHTNENQKEGKRSNLIKVLFFPLLKFVDNFIIKLGFLDGTHGFVYAAVMSFHSFLVWSNLWLTRK